MHSEKRVRVVSDNNDHIDAHIFSSNHRAQIMRDEKCGCFYCHAIFSPLEINEWVEDKSGTAICPHCGIDSVIGESSGYPMTTEFLEKMNSYWF